MRMIHREGRKILFWTLIALAALNLLVGYFVEGRIILQSILLASVVFYIVILQFFRNPKRLCDAEDYQVMSPVDGKVVVIEQIEESEYFNGAKRLQISIFMSPVNVHVTRYPVNGRVTYSKYHNGKYLVAWHPKSSTDNERTTVVVANPVQGEVMHRQIAGAMARRIVNYAEVGEEVEAGEDSGFIKFGSRVDVILPLGHHVLVELGQKVRGGVTVIAEK